MRRYTITIDGSDHEVDVEEVTANTFRVQIAGRAVDVRLRDHQDMSQAMITPTVEVAHAAPVAPVVAAPRPSSSAAPAATAPAAAPVTAPTAGGAKALTAPMPGVVLSISAQPGQQVSRGDLLVVLEAMKMKNELRASRDGVVSQVTTEVGQQVVFGQQLVVFE